MPTPSSCSAPCWRSAATVPSVATSSAGSHYRRMGPQSRRFSTAHGSGVAPAASAARRADLGSGQPLRPRPIGPRVGQGDRGGTGVGEGGGEAGDEHDERIAVRLAGVGDPVLGAVALGFERAVVTVEQVGVRVAKAEEAGGDEEFDALVLPVHHRSGARRRRALRARRRTCRGGRRGGRNRRAGGCPGRRARGRGVRCPGRNRGRRGRSA